MTVHERVMAHLREQHRCTWQRPNGNRCTQQQGHKPRCTFVGDKVSPALQD